jgi:hypothetical protein
MTISLIRTNMAAALSSVVGLNAYAEAPGQVEAPCVVIENATGEYGLTMGPLAHYTVNVIVLVSLAPGHVNAQKQLDGFLNPTGSGSVGSTIESDPTLQGACDTLNCQGYTYNAREYGGTEYLAAVIPVDIWASQ